MVHRRQLTNSHTLSYVGVRSFVEKLIYDDAHYFLYWEVARAVLT